MDDVLVIIIFNFVTDLDLSKKFGCQVMCECIIDDSLVYKGYKQQLYRRQVPEEAPYEETMSSALNSDNSKMVLKKNTKKYRSKGLL